MSQYALMTVARLGDSSHLPTIEKLLEDKSVLTRMQENKDGKNVVYDVQLRDAALAAAVMLTKQNLRDYFDIPGEQQLGDPQMVFFNARLIGFSSDEQRDKVFAKWQKYKEGQSGDSEK
jgi:hypothetical protein